MKRPPMIYHPVHGSRLIGNESRDPADWRPVAGTPRDIADQNRWRFDPWSGNIRRKSDFDADPFGICIAAPGEALRSYKDMKLATDGSVIPPVVPPVDRRHEDRRTVATRQTNPKSAAAATRVPLWLCSTIAKIHWAMAQFAGLTKYGAWNWRVAGVRASEYLSAIERHLEGYKSGERVDPVDGTHHLGNIMACCALMLDAEAAGLLVDDRPPRIDHRPLIAEAEKLLAKLREQYKDIDEPRHYTIADSVSSDTLSASLNKGEDDVSAARPVPTTGHADGAGSKDRAPGREEA